MLTAQPSLERWGIFLDSSDGFEECENILRKLAAFFADEEAKKIDVDQKCRFSGDAYGRDKIPNGKRIMTSPVVTIERVAEDEDDEAPYNFLCVTTRSGTKYYIRDEADDVNFTIVGNLRQFNTEDEA